MPTPLDRSRLRGDVGDTTSTFTDAEVDDFFARAAEKYPTSVRCQFYEARLIALDQMLINLSKNTDYSAGGDSDSLSQMFSNLLQLRPIFQAELEKAEDENLPKARWGVPKVRPTKIRTYPDNW